MKSMSYVDCANAFRPGVSCAGESAQLLACVHGWLGRGCWVLQVAVAAAARSSAIGPMRKLR